MLTSQALCLQVLDWGAEMEALSPNGSKSESGDSGATSSSQSPNESPGKSSPRDAAKRRLFVAQGPTPATTNEKPGKDTSDESAATQQGERTSGDSEKQNVVVSSENQNEGADKMAPARDKDVAPVEEAGKKGVAEAEDEEEFEDATEEEDSEEFVDAGSNLATPQSGSREVSCLATSARSNAELRSGLNPGGVDWTNADTTF